MDLTVLKKVKLHGEDLRGTRASALRWTACRIDGCSFDGAVLRDLRIWDTTVTDCSFAGADLRGAVLGSWHKRRRNRWQRVSFAGADLRDATIVGALFDGCDFSNARLNGAQFEQCDLRDCTFAGDLTDVIFDCRPRPDRPSPAPLRDLDFGAATFHHTEFRDCHPQNVVLPEGVTFIPAYRSVARRALQSLALDTSPEATILRAELTLTLQGPGTESGATLYNPQDYKSENPTLAALAHHHLTS
ncbi:pentapeptide repeat-containing protein [Kribbella sp. NBC_00482]|uniref:pentapeptide repeat-containing protein n=1 Tax=Kribbella sp. NBC_00482 TaxID=2975968 RepID=UPI002E172E1B